MTPGVRLQTRVDPEGRAERLDGPGVRLQPRVDPEGRAEFQDGPGSGLDASGAGARPPVDVDATARAAGVDDDRVLVASGGRRPAATRLHRGAEVQRPSTRSDGCASAVVEYQEQLEQQRRTRNDTGFCRYTERCGSTLSRYQQ